MGSLRAPQLILLISADPALRERLYDELRLLEFQVLTASTGAVGVEMLKHRRADLIMADSRASHSEGWGLADQVRRFDQHVPIILLGSDESEAPDNRTLDDIQAFLSVELSRDTIEATIRRWLPKPRAVTPINYPGTILLVDDEPELVQHLAAFLGSRGCEVVTASSGEEALEQAACHKPSLAILDIKMTGMDGLITLKKLRAKIPAIHVIMATAVQDQALMGEAFMLGAYAYITKPYNLHELEETLRLLKRLSRG